MKSYEAQQVARGFDWELEEADYSALIDELMEHDMSDFIGEDGSITQEQADVLLKIVEKHTS